MPDSFMYPISPAGEHGIVSDIPPHELPPNAWSSGNNVHFSEGYAEKIIGHRSLFGGASVAPYFLTTVRPTVGNAFWIYAGATAVYAYDAAHHIITRVSGAYTSSGARNWQGGVMNGLLFLNNGADIPQVWVPAVNTQKLIDLPNWPVNTRAAVIRSFKNFMIALDVTKSGNRDSRLVKWSHPAAVGSYPSSWDETDTTKDAGEYSMAESEGLNIDCVPLRDVNIIYKDDSVWGMSYVGGTDIFRFFNIFRNIGIVGKNCAVEFQTGQHLVFARDDVYVHDGQVPHAILRGKTNKQLYNRLDATNATYSFVALDTAKTEIMICYPETGFTYCNMALVWNWRSGAIGFRDLPQVSAISTGIANELVGLESWGGSIGTWDSDAAEWSQTAANPAQTRLVMAVPDSSSLFGLMPDTTDFAGESFTSSLKRTGISAPIRENQLPDISSMKFCLGIWPRITGTAGGIIHVRFGTQMTTDEEPAWETLSDFIIGTTVKVDTMKTGRLFAVEFWSDSSISWRLHGYSLELQYAGEF